MVMLVRWDNMQQTAVRLQIDATADWDTFMVAVRKVNALIASVDHPVDLIVMAAQGATPPPGALLKFRRIQEQRPANQGLTVLVGGHVFMRLLFNTFARVYPNLAAEIAMVATLEDARALLIERQSAAV